VSSPAFEAFLARLYVDADFRAAFLADPAGVAGSAPDLAPEEIAAVQAIDRAGLELAAASFAWKRAAAAKRPPGRRRWLRRLVARATGRR
jgi:hypothetical protein